MRRETKVDNGREDGDRKIAYTPSSPQLPSLGASDSIAGKHLAFRSHTPPASFTGTRRETQRRAERRNGGKSKMHTKDASLDASLSRVPSLGAWRVML